MLRAGPGTRGQKREEVPPARGLGESASGDCKVGPFQLRSLQSYSWDSKGIPVSLVRTPSQGAGGTLAAGPGVSH